MPNAPRRYRSPWILVAILGAAALVAPRDAPAEGAPPAENVVQIQIVGQPGAEELKIVHRGVGICRKASADCANQVTWQWTGKPKAGAKIVIRFITGTAFANNCLVDAMGKPRVEFEIAAAGSDTSATASEFCPPKSAWIYQVSCVMTNGSGLCPGIAPIDPGVIIGG